MSAPRKRWLGATGRRVPEIALEGSLDLEGALVLDSLPAAAELQSAYTRGTPIAIRAATADDVKMRARPARGVVRARARRVAPRARPRRGHL